MLPFFARVRVTCKLELELELDRELICPAHQRGNGQRSAPLKEMSTKIVFLCKGTRGDVQPLLSIALAYKCAVSLMPPVA